jgi:hypothetical protein
MEVKENMVKIKGECNGFSQYTTGDETFRSIPEKIPGQKQPEGISFRDPAIL